MKPLIISLTLVCLAILKFFLNSSLNATFSGFKILLTSKVQQGPYIKFGKRQ